MVYTFVDCSICADVSTTMLVKPGPVIDSLLFNQNINHTSGIDGYKVSHNLTFFHKCSNA